MLGGTHRARHQMPLGLGVRVACRRACSSRSIRHSTTSPQTAALHRRHAQQRRQNRTHLRGCGYCAGPRRQMRQTPQPPRCAAAPPRFAAIAAIATPYSFSMACISIRTKPLPLHMPRAARPASANGPGKSTRLARRRLQLHRFASDRYARTLARSPPGCRLKTSAPPVGDSFSLTGPPATHRRSLGRI